MNKATTLELLFDEPIIGQSQYGQYYLYAVKNGSGSDEEYSYFAPDIVHEQLKELPKGTKVEIIKLAEQKGTKVVTNYALKVLSNGKEEKQVDNYYQLMLNSCKEAIKIQNELGGMFDAKSIAVTLFIARSKINGYT